MRTIKFSEDEISFLHKVYHEKLVQTEKDLQRIKDFLKKLEVPTFNEPVEEESIVLKRPLKPKVKDLEPKLQKKRGRKPKAIVVEPKVPKKRGRPKNIPSDGNTPLIIANESKKRGRKPKAKVVEPKVPKKRGRKPKVVVPTNESVPETIVKEPKKRGRKPKAVSVPKGEPKKRGRKPKVSNESTPEPEPVSTNKEEKKVIRKKSPYKKNRKWRGLRLANLSKPLKLKEPQEKSVDEITSEVEPVVPPTVETFTAQIEEQNITPTEESKE